MTDGGRIRQALKWGGATAVAVLILGAALRAKADAPLLMDDNPRFESNNRHFLAIPGSGMRSAMVFRRQAKKGAAKLWEMAGWPYAGYLDDDGEHLASGAWETSLLKRGYTGQEVIVTFYKRGALIKAVRVADILLRPYELGPPSESGYSWGTWKGFVALHRFALDTEEGRRLIYDVTTGALVQTVRIAIDKRSRWRAAGP